jgi:hypothetical protein
VTKIALTIRRFCYPRNHFRKRPPNKSRPEPFYLSSKFTRWPRFLFEEKQNFLEIFQKLSLLDWSFDSWASDWALITGSSINSFEKAFEIDTQLTKFFVNEDLFELNSDTIKSLEHLSVQWSAWSTFCLTKHTSTPNEASKASKNHKNPTSTPLPFHHKSASWNDCQLKTSSLLKIHLKLIAATEKMFLNCFWIN